MLRIIVKSQYWGLATHVKGGEVEKGYNTFDIECSEIEEYLKSGNEVTREIVGVEVLK